MVEFISVVTLLASGFIEIGVATLDITGLDADAERVGHRPLVTADGKGADNHQGESYNSHLHVSFKLYSNFYDLTT